MKTQDTPRSNDESHTVIERYETRLRKHGFGEEALGWGKKGRQQLRLSVLASHWDLGGKSVLDQGWTRRVRLTGLFNFRLNSRRNSEFISSVLGLAFKFSRLGVASNFVTDHVGFKDSLMHYLSPSEALDIAHRFTRNVTLKQDYMPFEYSVFLDKRQAIDHSSGLFRHIGLSE